MKRINVVLKKQTNKKNAFITNKSKFPQWTKLATAESPHRQLPFKRGKASSDLKSHELSSQPKHW